MKSIKRIWNSFKIAFSMYSRIPMPRSEWTDENKSYAMCFFPWIGAVIGLLSYGVNSSGRISGYTGCAEFLADERASSGNTERFPRRSICYHFMYHLFSDVYWRVFLSECTEYGSDRI